MHVWTQDQTRGLDSVKARLEAESFTEKAVFTFSDFDGEEIQATTHIEEREWRRGTGWWRWLSVFWPAKVRRNLDIEFNKEVGPKKGSWKGGRVGHGIDLLPGELHSAAFARYCVEHKLTVK